MGPGARSADTRYGNTGGTARSAAGPYSFNSEAGSARNQPQGGRNAFPARSFPPLSGKTAPCTVPVSTWLSMRAEHFGFPATLVRTLYTEKKAQPPHAQKGHGGGGAGGRPSRLWDSRTAAEPAQTEQKRTPAVRLAHPREGRPERAAAPGANEPTPHTHRTPCRTHDHQPAPPPKNSRSRPCAPAEGRKRNRHATPGARNQPKEGTPAGGNIQITGGAQSQRQRTRERPRPAPRKREGPNTSPHHSGLATEAPATSRPARKGPDRPTNPTTGRAGRWRGRDRAEPITRRSPPQARIHYRLIAGGAADRARATTPPHNTVGAPVHPAEQRGAGDTIA